MGGTKEQGIRDAGGYSVPAGSQVTGDMIMADRAAGRLSEIPYWSTDKNATLYSSVGMPLTSYSGLLTMSLDDYNKYREYNWETTDRLGREEEARRREELRMNKLAQRDVIGTGGSNTAVLQKATLG